jgi:hypothetical protein
MEVDRDTFNAVGKNPRTVTPANAINPIAMATSTNEKALLRSEYRAATAPKAGCDDLE